MKNRNRRVLNSSHQVNKIELLKINFSLKFWAFKMWVVSSHPYCCLQGAGVVQWRAHSPPTNVAQLRFLSYELSLFLVPFSTLTGFSLGTPVIPLLKNQHLQTSIWCGTHSLLIFIFQVIVVLRRAVIDDWHSFLESSGSHLQMWLPLRWLKC